MITRLRLRLRSLLLRRRLEREMQQEMAEHLARSTERLVARGLPSEEARREALREFGNVGYHQEEGRLARGTGWLDTLLGDLRFALRHFARNPLSTVAMILVLSLGIGLNVVLFTLVQNYTARPPIGIEASADLVRIRGSQRGTSGTIERAFTLEELQAYEALGRHFTAVGGWTSQPVTATALGLEEITVTGTFVTDGYFPVLRIEPMLGRWLAADPDEAQSVVLSHAVWTRLYAEDPEVLGRTISLSGTPFTVVGVAPPGFHGALRRPPDGLQAWLPLAAYSRITPSTLGDGELFRAIGRLAPAVRPGEAGAAVQVVATRITGDEPAPEREPSADVVPLLNGNNNPAFDGEIRIVRGIFGSLGLLILMVTCLNTSALQTGLALSRRREIAIRTSLGASRLRVIRQLVTESVLLAAVAAVAAIGVTVVLFKLLLLIDGEIPFDLAVDRSGLLFAFGLAIGAGILFGLSPALHATREAVAGALKDTASSVAGARGRLQRGLVVAQVALTQPLAVCVAVFVLLAVYEFRDSPRNPDGDRIVSLRLATAAAADVESVADSTALAAERVETGRLFQALREVRGIDAVVYFPNDVLLSQDAFAMVGADGTGREAGEPFYVTGRIGMPGYLDLMGMPVLLGRDLLPADTAAYESGVLPAVIGDDMARALWGDANPIGRRVEPIEAVSEPRMLEVVGVYEEPVDASGSSRQSFTVFVPPRGLPSNRFFWLRTSGPAEAMIPAIRDVVRRTAPGAAITGMRTVRSMEDEERYVLWGATTLISAGGAVALLLSALGLYAVVSFAVGKRTREIAVRMAVGARPQQIVRFFAWDGLRLNLLGVVIGLPLSVLGLRAILDASPEMPEVSLPTVTAVVAFGVVVVAGIAAWIPASRAARVDPAVTLRRE